MKNCVVYFVVLLAVASSAHYIRNTENILGQRNSEVLNLKDLYRASTGTVYSFHSECRNYEDARRTCKKNGGHLAVVNSGAEADLLAAIFDRYPRESLQCESELYLGVHYVEAGVRSEGQGNFVTFQGDTLEEAGYAKWADGEPNNLTFYPDSEKCVTFYRNKRLNDLYCGELRPFVCEISGYVYKRESNSRYKLHLNSYKPARAARVCRSHGGHLASVDTEAEALMIKQAMSTIHRNNYVSLYKRKNPYFHVDFHLERTEPFSLELDETYNQEPRFIAKNCTAIDTYGEPLGVSCEQENFFVCEIDNDDYEKIQILDIVLNNYT